jgi:hypothetical protein
MTLAARILKLLEEKEHNVPFEELIRGIHDLAVEDQVVRRIGWMAIFEGATDDERGWVASDDLNGLAQTLKVMTSRDPDRIVRVTFEEAPQSTSRGGTTTGALGAAGEEPKKTSES